MAYAWYVDDQQNCGGSHVSDRKGLPPLLVGALEAGVAALRSLCVFLEGALGAVDGTDTARDGGPVPGMPGSSSSLMELCCGDSEIDHSAAESSVTLDCLWGPVRAAVMLLLRRLLFEGA